MSGSDHAGSTFPNARESFLRLHLAGWTVGCMAILNASGTVWMISGCNGENMICVAGPTRDEAWWRACEQAEAVGMLGSPMLPTSPGGLDRQPDAPEPGDLKGPG